MSESVSVIEEKSGFDGTNANDVVPSQCTPMATEVETTTHNYKALICTSVAGSVSSLSLNDTIRTTATEHGEAVLANAAARVIASTSNTDSTEEERMIPNVLINANKLGAINSRNNNNNFNNNNGGGGVNNNSMKAKRRRRKSSKQKNNSKPYKKSNWNCQKWARNGSSRLVPYNTNQFLMEEHMPEIAQGGRYRDSSFSYDSDNDKEEYLSKEFSNVYEKARSDRLYDMSKTQLIQEYLQLEASYDKLSNSLDKLSGQLENGGNTPNNVFKRLADRIQELKSENLELRRQMADIRSRDSRHHNHSGSHHHHHHHHNHNHNTVYPVGVTSSEDSESDSSSSSSSSSSSGSSASDSDSSSSQMSGISDNADESSKLLIKNECVVSIDDETVQKSSPNPITSS